MNDTAVAVYHNNVPPVGRMETSMALNKYAPIQSGIMVTIHTYTGDQMTLD